VFTDRTHAGRELAARLEEAVRQPCVIAAIPRGGVAVALPISERLAAPLTVIFARKLTDPREPELAFGALTEDGEAILDQVSISALGLRPFEVEWAKGRVAAEIRRRIRLYRVPPLGRLLPGRTAIIVDDGLATGFTMQAAVAYARRHGAREVIIAVPCASADAAHGLEPAVDRVISLIVDDAFESVGRYYADFRPVGDDEVVAMLARAAEHVPSGVHEPDHRAQRHGRTGECAAERRTRIDIS
jgi:putative phosphoribosyl transferase